MNVARFIDHSFQKVNITESNDCDWSISKQLLEKKTIVIGRSAKYGEDILLYHWNLKFMILLKIKAYKQDLWSMWDLPLLRYVTFESLPSFEKIYLHK